MYRSSRGTGTEKAGAAAGGGGEDAVELGDGAEAGGVGDFDDFEVGMAQELFGFLDAGAGDELRESDTETTAEHFAEIRRIHLRAAG